MLIPKKEIVKFVLKDVLKKQKIRSQTRLAQVLGEKLRQSEKQYSITPERARMIAMETRGVRVRIRTKRGRQPRKCPACSHKLKRIYTRNLRGGKVLISMRCTRCSYAGSGKKWTPSRYEFEVGTSD